MARAENWLAAEADHLVACAKVLGALFYQPPNSPAVQPCLALMADLPQQWPWGSEAALTDIQVHMQNANPAQLASAWQALFIGPDHLAAPPWGSVYLDEESVLFGSSTLAWRAFLHTQQINMQTGNNDPEDHFGLMCWALAELADQQRWAEVCEMLEQHLLPWSGHYLNLLETAAPCPFYCGLAQLARLTLDQVQTGAGLQPAQRKIYFCNEAHPENG